MRKRHDNNLPTNRTYAINLDENKSIGTHWTVLYFNGNYRHILIALELIAFSK